MQAGLLEIVLLNLISLPQCTRDVEAELFSVKGYFYKKAYRKIILIFS